MKLYNTLTRKKEEFIPLKENEVKMYVCGLTVYNYMHIGNARPYVTFDTVRRYFEYKGYHVDYVQNFTDVDDKIIQKANEEQVTMDVISERYIKAALEDAAALNVQKATVNPRVTQEMDEIIQMIATLIQKGYAYEKNGSVYFNTKKDKEYGKLSHKNLDELEAGSRVEVDTEKINPSDFVLWKPKKEGEPFWASPWSEGRPGWHIECSVMAKKYLGETIDIHAGGEDLIFPHHENEIAQSECANGVPFAHYWMHNGFINVDNEKMSKSKGNFFTVQDIIKKFPADVIRFFILSSHYRSPINFSEELIKAAEASLERIQTCVENVSFIIEKNENDQPMTAEEQQLLDESKKYTAQFEKAMDDDFNTADAISAIFELVRFVNTHVTQTSTQAFAEPMAKAIVGLCDILGVQLEKQANNTDAEKIEKLIEERNTARKNKDWATADRIRDELNAMNVVLEDTPLGVRWSYKGR